jgi:membrane protein DedA with SNARE-associated domain
VISDGGYPGIVLLMLAEGTSELIMALAGFVAAKGEFNVGLVVLYHPMNRAATSVGGSSAGLGA